MGEAHMDTKTLERLDAEMGTEVLLRETEKALLSLGDELEGVEAIGICGSLARGRDFGPRSDIDVFVVLREGDLGPETHRVWWERIRKALNKLNRDITVLIYTRKALEDICNWYVLRLASEGIVILDRGRIKELFRRIVQVAEEAGLVEEEIEGMRVWTSKIKYGDVLEVKLR
jgi:predicted nucleotidyltransferase